MTEQQHPITPPSELVLQWLTAPEYDGEMVSMTERRLQEIADKSAQWGYEQRGAVNEAELQKARDEELDACCEWLETGPYGFSIEATAPSLTKRLRAARRPKPPSLKEQALKAQQRMWDGGSTHSDWELIRRALESLPD